MDRQRGPDRAVREVQVPGWIHAAGSRKRGFDAKLTPLRRGPAEWVPGAEVRGEGLFLRVSEHRISAWLETLEDFNDLVEHVEQQLVRLGI